MEERLAIRISQWQGLNTRESDLELKEGQSPSIQNIEFFQEGWKVRNGVSKVNENSAGSDPINGIFDGWNHVLAMEGTNIHRVNTSTGALTSINTGLTNNATPLFASYNALDIMVNGNGNDNPKKWDGSSFADLGGSPPKADVVEVWRNHVWLGGLASPNQAEVRHSNIEDPETWDGGGFLRVSKREKGKSIVTIKACPVPDAVDGERLTVFCEDAIYQFDGYSKSLFNIYPVNNKIGAVAKRGVVVAEGLTFWLDENGFYVSPDGGRTVNNISWIIQPTLDDLNKSQLSSAVGVHLRYKRQIWWALANDDSSTNDIVLVYNYGLSSPMSSPRDGTHVWSLYKIKDGDTGFNSLAEVLVSGEHQVWAGDALAGQIYQVDDGTSDNGTAIEWNHKTKRFLIGGSWSVYQVLRKLSVVHAGLSDAEMTIQLFIDASRQIKDVRTMDLAGGGAEFGAGIFGVDAWGESSVFPNETYYNQMVRAVQFNFSGGDLDKLLRCYEIAIEVLPMRGAR